MLKSFYHENLIEVGCDEVGRGCLAGPVYAAAVILPASFYHPILNDSKKMNKKNRESLYDEIIQNAIAYSIQSVSVEEIDRINILKAAHKAMHLAIDGVVHAQPDHLLIDGNLFPPYLGIPHTCIIKGDGLYTSIAAASVIAKVTRDRYMDELDEKFPEYNWKSNKGYGTKAHLLSIEKYGKTNHHRSSFKIKCMVNDTN